MAFLFLEGHGGGRFPWPFFLEVIAMVIIMKKSATEGQIESVIGWIESVGTRPIRPRAWKEPLSALLETTGARPN